MKPTLDRATQANQYRAHPCCVLPCWQWLLGIRPQILVCRISSVNRVRLPLRRTYQTALRCRVTSLDR